MKRSRHAMPPRISPPSAAPKRMTEFARRPFLGAALGFFLSPKMAGADVVARPKRGLPKPAPYWNEIPDSALAKSGLFEIAWPPGVGGSAGSQLAPWCGGDYAPSRREFLMGLNGGHGDGNDNSPYAFSLDTLKWRRLAPPSPIKETGANGVFVMEYGGVSRHTYGSQVWAENAKRLLIGGIYAAPNAGPTDGDWLLDPETGAYERLESVVTGAMSAYDPERGLVLGASPTTLTVFDALARRIVKQAPIGGYGGFNTFTTAAYDTKRKQIVWITGPGIGTVMNVANLAAIRRKGFCQTQAQWTKLGGGGWQGPYPLIATPIADDLAVGRGHGLAYHPGRDRFYAWDGGRDVLEVDPEAFTVRRIATPLDKPVPQPSSYQGIFGRWRYVAEFDCFLAIPTNPNANVWLYKSPT
jgi:hypothetical protein